VVHLDEFGLLPVGDRHLNPGGRRLITKTLAPRAAHLEEPVEMLIGSGRCGADTAGDSRRSRSVAKRPVTCPPGDDEPAGLAQLPGGHEPGDWGSVAFDTKGRAWRGKTRGDPTEAEYGSTKARVPAAKNGTLKSVALWQPPCE
jgi:hypothetical protein